MADTARSPLWTFAVSLYGRPGAAEACLLLQEKHGLDVPVLLFAAWLGSRGIELTEAGVGERRAAVGEWHRDVVVPLRAVRRRLKDGPHPAPSPATEAMRTRLKAVELESERIELALLEASAEGLVPSGAEGDDTIRRNLLRTLRGYGGGEPDARDGEALALLAAAATLGASCAS